MRSSRLQRISWSGVTLNLAVSNQLTGAGGAEPARCNPSKAATAAKGQDRRVRGVRTTLNEQWTESAGAAGYITA